MSSHTLKIGLIIIIALSLFTLFSEEVSTPVTDENRLSDNDILAEFNGGKILRKDLDAKISKLPPQIQGRYKTVDSQIQILDIMATEDVFFAEAISRNIDKDPIVLERLDRAKRQFFIQEYYKRFVADAVVITEQAREKYYSDNIKSFFISPYLSINYIQAENEVAALAALNELKAGTPFEEVSEKYNQNTYAKGLKGKVKNIRLNGQIPGVGDDPELDAYISQSTVDPNTFHGPYQTKTGWHIFSTLERVEGRQRPYAEVADDINSRLRPVMEKELLDMIVENLKQKYSVTVDTLLVKDLNLQEKVTDENILNKKLVDSPNADLVFTVRQILDIYSKMPPQEQMFHSKSGANSLITQELSRNLMFLDSEGRNFETVLENNEDYIQTKRYHILQEAYKRLVVDAIQVSPEEVKEYFDAHIDSYTTPASRQIEVLWFEDDKLANRIWKRYTRAVDRNRDKDIKKLITKYSTKPNRALLDNQYQNGVITGIGPDEEWSRRVWETGLGKVSPVFKSAAGEWVFFRVTKDNPPIVRPMVEAEPRIYGTLKKDKEKTQMEQVKENLFVQFDMKKYPKRIKLLLSADELFTMADNSARQRKFNDAMVFYDQIINNYKNNTDDYKAYFMKAFLVAEEVKKPDVALELFKTFLRIFPEGDLHESARFMIEELEGGETTIFEDEESEK